MLDRATLSQLLGFKLLPRLKNIGAIQVYAPEATLAAWPKLEKILKKRPIDWDLIARNGGPGLYWRVLTLRNETQVEASSLDWSDGC